MVFLCLQLFFGDCVNPPSWCCFSKMVVDLSNKIMQIESYDLDTLLSPLYLKVPNPKYELELIPLAQGKPLAVEITTTGKDRGD